MNFKGHNYIKYIILFVSENAVANFEKSLYGFLHQTQDKESQIQIKSFHIEIVYDTLKKGRLKCCLKYLDVFYSMVSLIIFLYFIDLVNLMIYTLSYMYA